ncbi:MAG: hypothetical protein ACK5HY_14315, partial [Parahaliea sp.]
VSGHSGLESAGEGLAESGNGSRRYRGRRVDGGDNYVDKRRIFHGIGRQQDSRTVCQTNDSEGDGIGECGEFAVVRDDYAMSLRVFAHEVLHLTGAVLQQIKCDIGESLEVEVVDGGLFLRPAREPEYSLDELLASCTPSKVKLTDEDSEWLGAKRMGKEAL